MTTALTHTGLTPRDVSLDDRYTVGAAPVLLTGVQAIARALIEQHARDQARGHRSATFVSGYQGSPLGGLDSLLAGIPDLESAHSISLTPGVNEELAATAVWGSQQTLPRGARTVDGVVGVWYGKGPGLDRASDSVRHANLYGTDPRGGVVAFVGDDPACKSSTLPFVSDATLVALNIPFLYPRSAEEIVLHTLLAVELSRASGCWVAVKIVADVADGLWTLDRSFDNVEIVVPELSWQGKPWTYTQRTISTPGESVLAEADLVGPRWAMVRAFLAANDLDVSTAPSPGTTARFGVISAGASYDSTLQSLKDLGVDSLDDSILTALRIAAPFPVDPDRVRRFAAGLETILVVEEKGSVLESQIKDALYGIPEAPVVVGKRDQDGSPLIAADGELVADRLHRPLRRVLGKAIAFKPAVQPPPTLTLLPTQRTPYFCSGCPHNRSTVVPEGAVSVAGIGCHALASVSARSADDVAGWTQMGGEGAQWIGQSAYTDVAHIFQNVGDGTFFHSGQLAVQAAIAANVNITYKVLYNGAVAMTGAQDPQGGLAVPALTSKLTAEGVRRIIVCADEPERYRGVKLAKGAVVWPRERLDEAQRLLREVAGVTVLIYDQQCAANARRLRKRGSLPARTKRVVINEAVCEGCGDCGVKSNCLSVQPVDTELGRKTRIDQTSCNTDYSCLEGDCPSFVTLETAPRRGRREGRGATARRGVAEPPAVEEVAVEPRDINIFLAGIGGTGILTVNQLLATAAMHAGYLVDGLDQTGLSQKAGPVVSHLRLATSTHAPSNRLGTGSADLVLAFDLLVSADAKYAGYARADRTTVIASTSRTPTGDMVANPTIAYPADDVLLERLRTRSQRILQIDALRLAHRIFGSTTTANLLLVGMAVQSGSLPIPSASIEEAIALNGVAVEANVNAFRWGRALAVDPECIPKEPPPPAPATSDAVTNLVATTPLTKETRRLVEHRSQELYRYQGVAVARRYVEQVANIWEAERRVGDRTELSETFARQLFKLTAYKDEYEVARLLTDPVFAAQTGGAIPGGYRQKYQLHPPVLRSLGMKRKLSLGPWARPFLRMLAHGKVVRGTVLDPFGLAHVRRVERRLLAEYRDRMSALGDDLCAETYDRAVQVAQAPDMVRGYESVKLANVRLYEQYVHDLMSR